MATTQEPQVITLDNTNSVQLLAQFVEVAQSKGAYLLQEAELLKRAADILLNQVSDSEINTTTAKNLLIQGIHKGQRHGAYNLTDAAMLHKVVQFVTANLQAEVGSTQSQPQSQSQPLSQQQSNVLSSDDLSDLAEPIPLKPKEV